MFCKHGCNLLAGVLLLLWTGSAWAQHSIQTVKAPPPKELKESIGSLFSEEQVKLLDAKGGLVAEIWFCKELSAKASPEQLKKGLSYREMPETSILGVLRIVQPMLDYRKQKIKPGVYTLRLGFQPSDGDHMGTAPYNEFCLLVPAKDDKGPDLLEPKGLVEASTKASGTGHPAVFLLFPEDKPPAEPKLTNKGNGHWVLSIKREAKVGDQKVPIGIGLNLMGVSASL